MVTKTSLQNWELQTCQYVHINCPENASFVRVQMLIFYDGVFTLQTRKGYGCMQYLLLDTLVILNTTSNDCSHTSKYGSALVCARKCTVLSLTKLGIRQSAWWEPKSAQFAYRNSISRIIINLAPGRIMYMGKIRRCQARSKHMIARTSISWDVIWTFA